MHRSGTSCLTGCLKNYGLTLGDVSNPSKYNQKGNQEKKEVFRLNEDLLNFNSGSWDSPPKSDLLNVKEEFATRRDNIIDGFKLLEKPWGIKDPRMLFTYPFWETGLSKHVFVGTFRHPTAVASSLAARKNIAVPITKGFDLWYQYNQKLLAYYHQLGFPIINFDLPNNEYLEKVKKIARLLSLDNTTQCDFFDPGLKHQSIDKNLNIPNRCQLLYEKLLDISI